MKAKNDFEIEELRTKTKRLQENQQSYLQIIDKKNYESNYPKPEFLKNHQLANPNSCYLQILGCRGAGKSTFINRIFQATGLRTI